MSVQAKVRDLSKVERAAAIALGVLMVAAVVNYFTADTRQDLWVNLVVILVLGLVATVALLTGRSQRR